MRQVFPDTKKFESRTLDGFMPVSEGLVKGDARFMGGHLVGKQNL